MSEIRFLPPAARFIKKIVDKRLKKLFQDTFTMIAKDPSIGEEKKGDLAGIYGYDLFYNKTNYEIAYRVYEENNQVIVVIMAGTRENFYDELKRYLK